MAKSVAKKLPKGLAREKCPAKERKYENHIKEPDC
jgi:hypothetical protein